MDPNAIDAAVALGGVTVGGLGAWLAGRQASKRKVRKLLEKSKLVREQKPTVVVSAKAARRRRKE
jgi:hypothetical protein